MSERLWAGGKILGITAMNAFGGAIVGRALKGLAAAIKRIPWGRLSKGSSKACFVKGTRIHTKDGLVPIEEIKTGDQVLSYNEKTKQTEYMPVTETFVRQTEAIVKLFIEGEAKSVETTPEHPFYVKVHRARDPLLDDDNEGEWKEAGELEIGDNLLAPDGRWKTLSEIKHLSRSETVYNFTVAGHHNYFVSGGNENYFVARPGILVHNANCSPNYSPKSRPTWGHTFETHGAGARNTRGLTGRARGTGNPQGQWLNNDAAARYLSQFDGLGQGPFSIRLPDGLGQVIHPGGGITASTRATLIPRPGGGFVTGFPIP